MALTRYADGSMLEVRETDADIDRRFGIAQNGRPTEEQLELQAEIRTAITDIAKMANAEITDGRNKSLALTALEDALMRFGKAIFEASQ